MAIKVIESFSSFCF